MMRPPLEFGSRCELRDFRGFVFWQEFGFLAAAAVVDVLVVELPHTSEDDRRSDGAARG